MRYLGMLNPWSWVRVPLGLQSRSIAQSAEHVKIRYIAICLLFFSFESPLLLLNNASFKTNIGRTYILVSQIR